MKLYQKNDDGSYTEVEGLTQPEVDKVVTDRLKREKEKYSDYNELKSKSEGYETKIKELESSKGELEGKLKTAELNVTRNKIMSEFKLDSAYEEFITGADEEAMRKQAEKLHNGFKTGAPELHKKSSDENIGSPSDLEDVREGLFGK